MSHRIFKLGDVFLRVGKKINQKEQTLFNHSAFVLVLGFFNFLSPSKFPFNKLLYATWNLFMSFWWIIVDIFFDRDFALTMHIFSCGSGRGGLPSLGVGLSCPSSKTPQNVHFYKHNINICYKQLN